MKIGTWRNHGPGIAVVIAVLTAGLFTLGIHGAGAVTHAPCAFHGATAPAISTVEENVTTIYGSGGIGGCPVVTTTTAEGVTITVALQHLEDGAWVTKAETTKTKGWNRYWRYARQSYATVYGICENGDWRTHVTGGDGFEPTEWNSITVTFLPGDSRVCGSYGGGD